MNDPVHEARAKIRRYWNIDGLHEIGIGAWFCAVVLAVLVLSGWLLNTQAIPCDSVLLLAMVLTTAA